MQQSTPLKDSHSFYQLWTLIIIRQLTQAGIRYNPYIPQSNQLHNVTAKALVQVVSFTKMSLTLLSPDMRCIFAVSA